MKRATLASMSAVGMLCLHTFSAAADNPVLARSENPAARYTSATRLHRVAVERALPASPAEAWRVLGRFCAISQWQSLVASCDVTEREGGIVRVVAMRDNSVFVERLDDFSHAERRFSYSLISGPLVPPDYRASFSIHPKPGSSHALLKLTAEFSAPPEKGLEISGKLQALFDNGLHGITTLLTEKYPFDRSAQTPPSQAGRPSAAAR